MMKKRFKRLEGFIEVLVDHERKNPDTFLFPASIDGQFAFDCLVEALMSPDYYITFPCCNTHILDEILRKYSKDYRRLIKKKQKELMNHGYEA